MSKTKTRRRIKTSSPRTRTSKPASGTGSPNISGDVEPGDLKLKIAAPKNAFYTDIRDKINGLKAGKAFLLECGSVDPETMMNRLNAALKRNPPTIPSGCVIRKRQTEDGKIAIICAKAE